MRAHRSHPKNHGSASPEVLATFPVGPDTHDSKWAQLGPEDAAFARSALRKYNGILEQHGQVAARFYLEGVADLKDSQVRTTDAQALIQRLDIDHEITLFFQNPIDTQAQPS